MGAVGAHLGRAFGAGLLGSFAATPVALIVMLVSMPPDLSTNSAQLFLLIPIAMMVFMTSLFATLPCALLIGAPVTWPFRGWIARNPWIAALAYGLLGAAAGRAASWWDRGDGNSIPLDPDGIFGPIFGAATAIALVWIIHRAKARTPDALELD